ncbi:hypothetical protein LINGRAPRIM_LOCUS1780 [Linum grandiflorum]
MLEVCVASKGAVGVKSFADVVRQQIFPSDGGCKPSFFEGDRAIRVDGRGVLERVSFLDTCFVFRLSGEVLSAADWLLFKKWAHKSWGISAKERFPLSDDLWMIKLPCKGDVERILRLGRWKFRGRRIDADRWMSMAGISKVKAEAGIVWVRFDGIPLHLRSSALFRHLGDLCGGFLDSSEKGCSLNSIRIQVRAAAAIPKSIPILFEDSRFMLTAMVEAADFIDGWRAGRSGVFVRVSDIPTGSGSNVLAIGEPAREEDFSNGHNLFCDRLKGIDGDKALSQSDSDKKTEKGVERMGQERRKVGLGWRTT